MRIAFFTLGCKVNSYETESVWALFKNAGYERVEPTKIADVYIINTCTVTNTADSKSRMKIRQAIKMNADAVIVVMGCYAQIKKEQVLEIEGVDIVIGTNERNTLLDKVNAFLEERKPIVKIDDVMHLSIFEHLEAHEFEHTRAFLKIQDGCNNFCSYCIIPFSRGKMRSKPKEEVLSEANRIVQMGYKEIVLTGIHTGGYGNDLKDYTFTNLVEDLLKIDGLERLRISSMEITQITDHFLELLASNKRLANHLHLPLQSGSEGVLKRMNRKYDKDEFRCVIKKIRDVRPDIAITTDVITGFPLETEDEFIEGLEFIKEINFSTLHVFPYSRRTGTVSAKLPDMNGEIKKNRVAKLLEYSNESSFEYAKRFKNQTLDVIPETYDNGLLVGHTSNYLLVEFEGTPDMIGKVVYVNVFEVKKCINLKNSSLLIRGHLV